MVIKEQESNFIEFDKGSESDGVDNDKKVRENALR